MRVAEEDGSSLRCGTVRVSTAAPASKHSSECHTVSLPPPDGAAEEPARALLGAMRESIGQLSSARAVELLRVGQWFKRLPSDFPIPFEVWEVFVMPHMVTRDYQPPASSGAD